MGSVTLNRLQIRRPNVEKHCSFLPDPAVAGVISRTEVELVDDPPTDPSIPVENLILDPDEIDDVVVVVFMPLVLTPPGIKPLDLDLSDPPLPELWIRIYEH